MVQTMLQSRISREFMCAFWSTGLELVNWVGRHPLFFVYSMSRSVVPHSVSQVRSLMCELGRCTCSVTFWVWETHHEAEVEKYSTTWHCLLSFLPSLLFLVLMSWIWTFQWIINTHSLPRVCLLRSQGKSKSNKSNKVHFSLSTWVCENYWEILALMSESPRAHLP